MLELEHHVQFRTARVGGQQRLFRTDAGHLAHGEQRITALEHLPAHLLQILVQPGPVGVMSEPVPATGARVGDPVG